MSMFLRLFFSFAVLLSAQFSFAQQNALVVVTQEDLVLRDAKGLVESYQRLNPKSYDYDYQRFQLIFDYIGAVEFKELDPHEKDYFKRVSNLLTTNEGLLTKKGLRVFAQRLKEFNENRYSGMDKVIIREANKATVELRSFATSGGAKAIHEMLKSYKGVNYSPWRNLKNGMVHLPGETFVFAAAIALVRVATCFGPSTGSLLSMTAPSHIGAKSTDPACMDEVARMFTDPIFYAGFAGFIAGSRLGSAAAMKALAKLDPAQGPITRNTVRFVVPNFALLIGFSLDHTIKTLLYNDDVRQCAFNRFKSDPNASAENTDTASITSIAQISDSEELVDIHNNNTSCRRAARYIGSDQFLKEELGTGIFGLLTTATILSVGPAGVKKAWQSNPAQSFRGNLADRKVVQSVKQTLKDSKRLKKLMSLKKVGYVLTSTNMVGLAFRGAHLVAFLGLFEALNPYFNEAYHLFSLEPNVEEKTDNFIKAYYKQNQNAFVANQPETCVQHYDGGSSVPIPPLCTRMPIIAEALSFGNYSANWRAKKILGEFNLGYSRWLNKLTSFFNNYFSSKDQLQILSRSREMYLTNQSEFFEKIIEENKERATAVISEKYKPSLVDERLTYITSEVLAHENSYDYATGGYAYNSEIQSLSDSSPDKIAFNSLSANINIGYSLAFNIEGDYTFNLQGDKDQIVSRIQDFLNESHVEVQHPLWTDNYLHTDELYNLLQNSGLSQLVPRPFAFENIKTLISSENPDEWSLGISLFRDWMPYMYGRLAKGHSPDDTLRNERGFTTAQYEIYNDLKSMIESYSPIQTFENMYLANNDFPQKAVFTQKKTAPEGQRNTVLYNLDTELQADYTLVEMMCGKERASQFSLIRPNTWFGDNDGYTLEFPFPQIMPESICLDVLHPAFDGNSSKASAISSVFATPYGLYKGLHNAYIKAPSDLNHPLIFSREEEAAQWWNSTMKTDALKRLTQLEKDYYEMVKEEFLPKLSSENLEDGGFQGFLRAILRPGSNERKPVKMDTSVNSLNLSLKNELFHYAQALKNVAPQVYERLSSDFSALNSCIDKLLVSISDKNYRVVKTQCESPQINVKNFLRYRQGKYDDNQVYSLLKSDEAELAKQPNGSDLVFDRFLIFMGEQIMSLFDEIESYNNLVNESFDFKLTEGEKP